MQVPPEDSNRNFTRRITLVGGLILLLVLLAVGSRYLFDLGNQPASPVASPSTSDPVPQEIPEEIPEEEAPHTPAPGFLDDFDDGLDLVWTVHYGDPFIENGQLTSHVGAGIAAGDRAWENYQIDFDIDTTSIECAFLDTSNSIGVRAVDFDHAYWFVLTSCESGWSFFPGGFHQGELSLLPDTRVKLSPEAKHITIKVEETKMSAYENGLLLSSIRDSSFRTGGIFLQVETGTLYDNFEVTLLP